MTTFSFESLGISKEDLTEKLLDRLVDEFSTEVSWDEDGNDTHRASNSATTWGTPKPTIGRLNKMDNDLTTPSAWLPIAMALGIVVWAYILGVV